VAGHVILHSRYVEKLLLTMTRLNSNSGQGGYRYQHHLTAIMIQLHRPLIFSITTKARLESKLKFIELMS